MKGKLITGALLLLATLFVPLIPNDASQDCDFSSSDCDDTIGYVSVYESYFK